MPNSEPFTGFYSRRMRDEVRCLTGDETKMFLTIALYSGPNGMARPGVRELHDATGYHTKEVSALLKTLMQKGLVIVVRQNERDPLTGQMLPDVYVVNPEIVLVKDRTFWQENRFRHSSMPESNSSVKTAQAEQNRIRKQNQEANTAKQTAPEGAAALPHVDMRNDAKPGGENAGANSSAGSQLPQSSSARSIQGSGAAGGGSDPRLGFLDSLAVEAIRRKVGDMSHEKAAELVAKYGVDRFNAAVLAMLDRNKKVPVPRPTGWIIRNLERGAKRP